MAVPKLRWILVIAVLAAVAVGAAFVLTRPDKLDSRFNGAYRLDDGRLIFVTAREGDTLRYRMLSGESRALWPTRGTIYEAGPGWSELRPVEVKIEFDSPEPGRPVQGLDFETPQGTMRGARVQLSESTFVFENGGLKLRGELVGPSGSGPFPAVVLVHGSGKESAVDSYFEPYLFAAHGVATLVYDKRGTGGSSGRYTQNFDVLAGDVVAALEWLRAHPSVDPRNLHLAGYSQGGWVAPLAASRAAGVASLLLCYGPTVPVLLEDRWGYVHALRKAGFGNDVIARADELNGHLAAIFDRGEDRWAALGAALEQAETETWFEVVKSSDSMLGFVAGAGLPLPLLRLYHRWISRGDTPFIDRLYDPVPTLASLEIPSLWIFGAEDSSMPTEWSVERLEALRDRGLPIRIEVIPNAEHGILLSPTPVTGGRSVTLRGTSPGRSIGCCRRVVAGTTRPSASSLRRTRRACGSSDRTS